MRQETLKFPLIVATIVITFLLGAVLWVLSPSQAVGEATTSDFTAIPIGKVHLSGYGVVRLFWVCEIGSCHKCVGWRDGYGAGLSCSFDHATDEEVILDLFE